MPDVSWLIVFSYLFSTERSGSGDSSGEEDSDEEDDSNRSQQDSTHDEVYIDCLFI